MILFYICLMIGRILSLGIGLIGLAACSQLMPGPVDASETLDGPLDGLTAEQHAQFLAGDAAFNTDVFTLETGLGPYFVAASCGSCHAGDGKGHPSTALVRFGQPDSLGNAWAGNGAPQWQSRALPGHEPEQLPADAPHATFLPPANSGLGFLDALSDAQILSNSDPNDVDGDGISGRPNWVHGPEYLSYRNDRLESNGRYVGRFGKKAAAVDLMHQTVNAYNQDMGITSDYAMEEPSIFKRSNTSVDGIPDPEIPASKVQAVVFYLKTLKMPPRRNAAHPDVLAGQALFTQIGCGKCHTPDWRTPNNDLAALSEKDFHPYTDLLLHDMGDALNDGYTEGIATAAEWKTPALWGLGLSKKSQGGRYFLMHDGRAGSISEAIKLHGGEAARAREQYTQLTDRERNQLQAFLESL